MTDIQLWQKTWSDHGRTGDYGLERGVTYGVPAVPGGEVGDGDGGGCVAAGGVVDVEARGEEEPVVCRQRDELVCRAVWNVVVRRQVRQRVGDHRTASVDVQQVQAVLAKHRTCRLLITSCNQSVSVSVYLFTKQAGNTRE